MCLGIPRQIIDLSGGMARARARDGTEETLSLALLGDVAPGQWVLGHLGTAMRTLDDDEARLIADALDGVAAAQRGESFEHLFADLIGRTPELPPHLRTVAVGGDPAAADAALPTTVEPEPAA